MKLINHENILKIGKYKKTSLVNINKKLAIELYTFMLKLRLCEEAIEKEYHPADEMRCSVHFCSGEEAVPIFHTKYNKKNSAIIFRMEKNCVSQVRA